MIGLRIRKMLHKKQFGTIFPAYSAFYKVLIDSRKIAGDRGTRVIFRGNFLRREKL